MGQSEAVPSGTIGRRPARVKLAAGMLGLGGLGFVFLGAALAIGAMMQTAPELTGPVTWLFLSIAGGLALLGILALSAAAGVWARRRWGALLGIVLALGGVLLTAFVSYATASNSPMSIRDGALYVIAAVICATCLWALLTTGAWFATRD